jgi:hypothetical protein
MVRKGRNGLKSHLNGPAFEFVISTSGDIGGEDAEEKRRMVRSHVMKNFLRKKDAENGINTSKKKERSAPVPIVPAGNLVLTTFTDGPLQRMRSDSRFAPSISPFLEFLVDPFNTLQVEHDPFLNETMSFCMFIMIEYYVTLTVNRS